MEYEVSDTSGTDDDALPPHRKRVVRGGHVAGNGRSLLGLAQHLRHHTNMDAQIHHLEKEAYFYVLRAFKAQSDALTWDKEGLITELRKELRVLDDEHRELLGRVNNDDVIRRMREWRQGGGHQAAILSRSQSGHDLLPSPTTSASRKKHKTSLSQPLPGFSTMNPRQYPTASAGSRQDPLIGRKLWTRWPDDNNFYEAVIINYNPTNGLYELAYDINTSNATYEWVDLKEIPPEDIQWEGEDPGIYYRRGHSGRGRGVKKSSSHGGYGPTPPLGRGKGSARRHLRNENLQMQNGVSDYIEIFDTRTLVKEVERILNGSSSDSLEIVNAKKMLQEHEQELLEVIARLADVSDGESDAE